PTCATCELHAEAIFRVEGMDCREEVVILERRLKPLVGLEAVSADLIGQRLHVKYDAAKLNTSTMVDAVGQTGMRMWLEHDEPASQRAGDWRWRLVLTCGALALVGVVCARGGLPGLASGLYVSAALVGGVFPARRAAVAIRARALDINVLMVLAALGAIVLGDTLEAASVVFLFAVAQWLEVRTMNRARQAIRALIDLAPREALVRRGGRDLRLSVEEIAVGEHMVIRPGEKIPLDGVVLAGHSDVNEASITGESLPMDKVAGAEVFAGTINGRGTLDVRVSRLGRDTRLAHIVHLVERAQAQRAPVQTFVDRFAGIYTPVVVLLALCVGLLPWLSGMEDPAAWAYRALVLLVIACPCALVISTPVSIVAALSAAARNGVLIKGGAHLERLAAVRVVAFDKTGTLTRGELRVTDVLVLSPETGPGEPEELLRYAAAVESRSAHPVAAAISAHAHAAGIVVPAATAFMSMPGLGAEGVVEGLRVVVGNEALFESRGLSLAGADDWISGLGRKGKSLVFVAVEDVTRGAIAVADRPRETAREAIELLRAQGIRKVVMLTGDNADSARSVAAQVGVDEYHAGLLPERKHAIVASLRARGDVVLMVGDGVNDAPALAVADVGAAMGAAASDAALEAADVALMSDELLRLPYAIRLARATLRNVRTNVAISLVLKLAFLALAVTGSATLWAAVLADTGATLVVVANALRLLRAR
ncbi:MAG: cation-translocating P-type ATPase, partial [Vicinamibacterales bacterium]